MPLNFKITWGAGASSSRMMGLADETTLAELKALVATRSGIKADRIQLKAGFPPKDVYGVGDDTVVSLGVTSGSALTVHERKASLSAEPPATELIAPTRSTPEGPRMRSAQSMVPPPGTDTPQAHLLPPPAEALPGMPKGAIQSLVDMGFPEEQVVRALQVAGGDINTALELCMGIDPVASSMDGAAAPSTAGTIMVRRIIDADNSCLFNALGYALRRKRKVGAELRQMITEAVRANPEAYNEGILGKQPEDYCSWISDPKSWGGEIELSILSRKLAVMITVVDIQTNNAYSYGGDKRHNRRIFVIYDGVHYDALAEAAGEGAPEADDVTTFDPSDAAKLDMAKRVAADLKSRNQFTDMGNADLKCMVCLKLLVGQTGALEHARATGHQNFGQI